MKKLLIILLGLFFIVSCSDDTTDIYEGAPLLQFSKGTSKPGLVEIGSASANYAIDYGVVRPVTGSHTVKLVVDATKSTAVEGVDFEILNSATDELTTGELNGTFTVRVLSTNLTTVPVIAVFNLQSSTIANAGFDQSYTLSLSLKCPLNTFFSGGFNNNPGFWNAPTGSTNGGQYLITTVGPATGKLYVKDFLDIGRDLVLSYNTAETVFTVDDQYTGSDYVFSGVNRQIWVRQRSGTSNAVNVCGRTMKLQTQYYLNGTTAAFTGDTSETFTGF